MDCKINDTSSDLRLTVQFVDFRRKTTGQRVIMVESSQQAFCIDIDCFFITSLLLIFCRVAELYEYAMLPEHMRSPDPTVGPNSITETGALCISSGSKAGRVPKQKRIVEDDITRDVSEHRL